MGLAITINRPVWLSDDLEVEFDVTVNSNSTEELIPDDSIYQFNGKVINITPVIESQKTGLFPAFIGNYSIDESAALTMSLIINDAEQALLAAIAAIKSQNDNTIKNQQLTKSDLYTLETTLLDTITHGEQSSDPDQYEELNGKGDRKLLAKLKQLIESMPD